MDENIEIKNKFEIFEKNVNIKKRNIFLMISFILAFVLTILFTPDLEYKNVCGGKYVFYEKMNYDQYEAIASSFCAFEPLQFGEVNNEKIIRENILSQGILNTIRLGALLPIFVIVFLPIVPFLTRKAMVTLLSILFFGMFSYLLINNFMLYLHYVYGV